MKKHYMKWSGLILTSAVVLSSCMSEVEPPEANQLENAIESAEIVSGSENLRTIPGAYNYMEEFDNQIFFIAIDGLAAPEGLYPGTGVGSATRFGKGKKSYSFINQLAQFNENFQLITTGAPVTDIFGADLVKIGLVDIPSNVSSVTTDGEGNAIWFENVENITSPVNDDRIEFKATIKVVGGNGRFAKAYGEGVVEGYFNPNLNSPDVGKGKSKVMARINY